jgi:hypothetical protein
MLPVLLHCSGLAGVQPRLSIHTISEMKDTNLYKVRC